MKIGIDATVLQGKDAGSLRYFEQLLTGLAEFGSMNDYVVLVNQRLSSSVALPRSDNLLWREVSIPRLLPPALGQQLLLPWKALEELKLLHSPVFVPPLLFDGRTVMTVFDLTSELYSQTMKWTGRLWWKLLRRRGIEKANRIIALSQSTKKDLQKYYGITENKVKVVYPCTRRIFKPILSPRDIAVKYGLPEKYILFVGTLERRKNIANLIRAYARARQTGKLEHKLILCGKRGWLYDDIFRTIVKLELQQQVILLGYVSDEDLPGLYSAADLFAYISFYEGFGLPVLEAMACGTPILCSNTSSLPEVVGEASVMVSPNNVDQIASEMVKILTNRDLANFLVEKGLERAKSFSIERFIRQTLDVYSETV